ncbi:GNAT family N-acetyltransferase [Nocardia mangyaensis]|uniref:GNAT family N-acetyltransferase n=1 Tax=Nocardia mangyaensis TaxID=2213200 RepID=A0A1J0W2P4_9NOCA|nr:GNAT family N-acetyltransferase [Nocardia mangyaensis]APE38588.1 GNAT family N-acetyltransferase [Nocardia mangyaensis]
MMSTVALKRAWSADLDAATLYRLLRLRVEVFVVEQECAYPELDGRDLEPGTRHLWLDGDGAVLATLRLLEEQVDGVRAFRIGRVCVARFARGRGYTARLMRAALAETGTATVRLDAQSPLVEMYAKFGFVVDGPEYDDDGILHVPMRRG